MKTTKRPTSYDKDQHDLICKALDCSPLASAPGCTAYEAVCVLLTKLEHAQAALNTASKRGISKSELRETLALLKKHHDDDAFAFIQLYGT